MQVLLQRLKEAEQFKEWEAQEDMVLHLMNMWECRRCDSYSHSFTLSKPNYGLRYELNLEGVSSLY